MIENIFYTITANTKMEDKKILKVLMVVLLILNIDDIFHPTFLDFIALPLLIVATILVFRNEKK